MISEKGIEGGDGCSEVLVPLTTIDPPPGNAPGDEYILTHQQGRDEWAGVRTSVTIKLSKYSYVVGCPI